MPLYSWATGTGSVDPERMTKKVNLTVDQFSIAHLVYDLYPSFRQAQYKLLGSGQADDASITQLVFIDLVFYQ